MDWFAELFRHIKDHESIGSINSSASLGFVQMPKGYALMLNPDESHFYFLRWDGGESCIHWNKWAVYRMAKRDREQRMAETTQRGE